MATYKVPQDVEADDKLLGPFTFRQFIYLMIVFGLIMVAAALFQVSPILSILPIPIALFFGILALPIKKDQPMETYVAALWSFYTKPNKRYWMPGQSESTILITAPKKVEAPRARNLSADEAGHRLSFLAEIVDSEGHAIKNASTPMKDEFYAEAYNATDMFDKGGDNYHLDNMVDQQQDQRRAAIVEQMRSAIAQSEYNYDNREFTQAPSQSPNQKVIQPREGFGSSNQNTLPSGVADTVSGFESPAIVQPMVPSSNVNPDLDNPAAVQQQMQAFTSSDRPAETIQQEADRIRKENESEVYVSLH